MTTVEMVEKPFRAWPLPISQHSGAGSLNLTRLPGILRSRPMRQQVNWTHWRPRRSPSTAAVHGAAGRPYAEGFGLPKSDHTQG